MLVGSVGARQEWKEVDRLNLCGKAINCPPHYHQHHHHPTLPKLCSHFPPSALFSRIIDGACEVQRTGMKMSQSQGCKTRAKAKGGAAGGGTTCSIYCCVQYEGRVEEKWKWSLKWSNTQLILQCCHWISTGGRGSLLLYYSKCGHNTQAKYWVTRE